MGPDPISLVNTARRDLQTLVNLVSNYERTRDAAILSDIVKLSLSIYDNAINAFLAVKGIRVKDPEHLGQVAHDLIPSNVASANLRDFLIKCLSQTDCNADFISTRLGSW